MQIRGRLAVFVVMLVMIVMFAACSGGSGSGTNSTSSSNEKGGNSPSAETSSGKERLSLDFVFPLHGELPEMDNEYWTQLQEVANVDFNIRWIPGADFTDRVELMLTSGDNIPEVLAGISPSNITLYQAIQNGVFWDLTPLLDDFSKYPNLAKNAEEGVFDISKINGKIYGIPRMRSATEFNVMMRHDWLEKYGIPEPSTLDEYKEALKRIVEADPSGQGTVGLAIHGVLGGIGSFVPAFGVFDPTYDEDGGLIRDNLTPQYADMIEWFRGLYEEGLLPQEFAAISATQAEDLFTSGRAVSYDRNIFRQWLYGEANRNHTPGAYVRSVELEGPGGYTIPLTPKYVTPFFISKAVSEEKVYQILDFLEMTASEEMLHIGEYGFEGIHFNYEDGYPVMTEKGNKEITNVTQAPFVFPYSQSFKAIVPTAPPEWNEKTMELIADWEEKGSLNQFNWLISHKYNDVWPSHVGEYETRIVQAVIGEITMEAFREYQDYLRNLPEMKEAFQEYAEQEAMIDFQM